MVFDEVTGEAVGLRGYDCANCSERQQRFRGCRLFGRHYYASAPISVDFHQPPRASLDEILFCPVSIPNISALQSDAYELVGIKDAGGLREYFGIPASQLPESLVAFFAEVEAASERYAAEIRAALKHRKEA